MDYADWGPIDNFSATEILKLLVCLQEHYPDHAKKIYFVNVPWVHKDIRCSHELLKYYLLLLIRK